MKKHIAGLLAVFLMLLSACGPEQKSNASSAAPPADSSAAGDEKIAGRIQTFGLLDVWLPDETWSGKSDALETVHLYKKDHFKGDDPTIKIFLDEKGLADSQAFADSMFPALPESDFELTAGPYTCVGNRTEITVKTTAVIDRIFYPVSEDKTLRFQVFVKNGSVDGLEKDDPEILSIIQSVIELNGFGPEKADPGEPGNTDGIVASGDDLGTTWTLDTSGVLHIGGKGDMVMHSNAADYQWAKYRDDVTGIVFDTNVTRISSLAFKKFKNLKYVEIPSSVKEMRIGCFEECTSLEEAVLPEGLQEVEYYVFAGCSSLKEITVPGTLEHISNYAFDSCTSLETATISPGVKTFGYDVFSNCTSLKTVRLPKSLQKIDLYSFYNTGLQEVCYEGDERDFSLIEITDYNDDLLNAEIHYDSAW